MNGALQSDVEFYTLVHLLQATAAESAEVDERRRRRRTPFACRQWVAVTAGDETPPESAYRSVACHDISTGGFSFVVPRVPEGERLSVRLGLPGEWLYLSAQIAHCKAIEGDEGPAVMVGCKFLGRE